MQDCSMFNKSQAFERWWPLVAAVIVALIWYAMGAPFAKSPDSLFGAAATVASIFASFLGVSKAIILTIKGSETYRALKEAELVGVLFSYLRAGIFASVAFAALSILGFFVSQDATIGDHKIFCLFELCWIFAAVLAMCTYLRISLILFKMLQKD